MLRRQSIGRYKRELIENPNNMCTGGRQDRKGH